MNRNDVLGHMDLLKSLPHFSGDPNEYAAWWEAEKFAMKY